MNNLDEIREIIVPVLKPFAKRVSIFGSYVRKDATPESDIDIVVALKPPDQRPPVGWFKWIELEEELEIQLGRPIDLITEDGVSPYIRPYIDQEKVVLYEEG
jgi:predicted nucleotidyltransferase